MAKPNYAYEKRQKELAKKQKKLEKLEQRKTAGHPEEDADTETSADEALEPATTSESN